MLEVKAGDVLTRYLSSARIPHLVKVLEVDDKFIYCYPGEMKPWPKKECWKFDRRSGAEVDEELGWSAEPGADGIIRTGSVIEVQEKASG